MTEDQILEYVPANLPAAYRRAAEQAADFVIEHVAAFIRQSRESNPDFQLSELPFGFLYGLGAIGQLWHWEAKGLRQFLSPDLPTAEEARQVLVELAVSDPVASLKFAVMLTNRVTGELWRLSCDSDSLLGAGLVLGEFDGSLIDEALAELLLQLVDAREGTNGSTTA